MAATVLVPYSTQWPTFFKVLEIELLAIAAPLNIAVEHIGSTSVPGLCAKPVVDVLLGAASLGELESIIPAMQQAGFDYVRRYEVEIPRRRYFVRSAPDGPRVHIHGVERDGTLWRDHLCFRDALRVDPALRSRYAELKQRLALQFPDDKSAYSAAKGPFIRSVIEQRA